MPFDQYDVPDWEAWALSGQGSLPERLRITTSYNLPFAGTALLRVALTNEGLVFTDEDAGVELIFAPPPKDAVRALFKSSLTYRLPVVLTEVHFAEKIQRTWLARAVS